LKSSNHRSQWLLSHVPSSAARWPPALDPQCPAASPNPLDPSPPSHHVRASTPAPLIHSNAPRLEKKKKERKTTQDQSQNKPLTTHTSFFFLLYSLALAKKYTQDHEWIELSPDNKTGTIGISTYAANALGDVVFVELPTTSLEVSAGDTIGSVESVKSASDIMTPVAGVIVEANSVLEDKPATINKSPEGDGWIAKIEVADVNEVEGLMDEEAYKAFTEESHE
jgi:glycine cleavage system H protein